jgi:DNA-directed RNA polymerase specialized sigma24 family protein
MATTINPAPTVSDEAMLALTRAADPLAADELFRRHRPAFLHHAKCACGSSDEAEDICQVACLNAFLHLSAFRDASAFCPWVLGFITNEAHHHL